VAEEPKSSVRVIERSVLWVAKDIVGCQKSQADPKLLEAADVPKSTIGKMR
jgi:hypothetical protein